MSWPTVLLGSIADIQSGNGFPEKFQGNTVGAIAFAKVGDISQSKRETGRFIEKANNYVSLEDLAAMKAKVFPEGSIVFAKIGEAIRKNNRVITKKPMAFDNNVMGIIFDKDVIDLSFALHYLNTVDFYSLSNSTTVPSLRRDDIASLKIPLPPLEEQKRIAGILDQADALRRLRARALEKLNTLGQAVFQEMFGDVKFNEKQFVEYKLKDFCEIKLGKMLDKEKNKLGEPRKYLRNANIRWFSFDLSSLYEMPFTEKEIERFSVKSGDLLICEGGEPGRCAIWEAGDEEIFYQKALHRLRINKDIAIVDFLERWFFAAAKSGVLSDSVTQATISHLTGEKIKNLSIFLPPIDLQVVFAARLTGVKDHLSVAARALNEAESLFASLQSAAFEGRL